MAGRGVAWQGRIGPARQAQGSFGQASIGSSGQARMASAREGAHRQGRQDRFGLAGKAAAPQGVARCGGTGMSDPRSMMCFMDTPTATQLLGSWDASRPRSQQRELGMSEIGGCRRQAGYRLAGFPAAQLSSTPAVMGTAIHLVFADAARAVLGDSAIIEDAVSFAGLLGHPDLFHDGLVVDLKTTAYAVQLDKVRREGPPARHVWQCSLYAAALTVRGHQVRRIRLNYLDRSNGEEVVWEDDFKLQHVRDALAWVEAVKRGPLQSLPRDYSPDSAYCRNCPLFPSAGGGACPSATRGRCCTWRTPTRSGG